MNTLVLSCSPPKLMTKESTLMSPWKMLSNVKFKEQKQSKCKSIWNVSFCVQVRTHKCLISWGLVRHIANPLFWQNNKTIITGGPLVAALVCALFAVAGGGTCTVCRATRRCYYDGDRHGGGRWWCNFFNLVLSLLFASSFCFCWSWHLHPSQTQIWNGLNWK